MFQSEADFEKVQGSLFVNLVDFPPVIMRKPRAKKSKSWYNACGTMHHPHRYSRGGTCQTAQQEAMGFPEEFRIHEFMQEDRPHAELQSSSELNSFPP